MDAETRSLIDKIGGSAVVVDTPAPTPRCFDCKATFEGEPKIVKNRYGELTTWHHECWDSYVKAREEERRRQQEMRINERIKYIRNRFEYCMSGNITGREGHGLCHPPQWEFARFDNSEFRARSSRKIVGALEKWDATEIPTLLLAGPTGSGKTAGVVAWLWRHLDQQIAKVQAGDEQAGMPQFIFATGPELAVARRNAPLGEEAPLIEHASDCGLLILDELGFEKLTEIPFELVDHRYRAKSVTVVTTGLKPADFRKRYGDAMFRRIAEGGAVVEDFPE